MSLRERVYEALLSLAAMIALLIVALVATARYALAKVGLASCESLWYDCMVLIGIEEECSELIERTRCRT